MGLKRDFILTSTYFLILSTVLQSQDAFVYYYDSQFQPQRESIRNSRGKMMIAFSIIATLNYFTLLLAPYLNCSIQKLAVTASVILLGKYLCQLATLTGRLLFLFELGALFGDIIGTGLFYLSTLRVVQILCDKYQLEGRSGICFGGVIGLYSLSVLLGYAFGYVFFEETPVWLFLVCLTSLTVVAGCIAYFTFIFQVYPVVNRVSNERQERGQGEGQRQGQGNGRAVGEFQLLRNGLRVGQIFKFTLITYKKMLPLMGIQTMVGTLIAYGYSLLQYLIWTSQKQSVSQKLSHNKDTMIIYAIGGIVTSLLIGIVSDRLPVRKLGLGLLIYNGLSMVFLYFAIYIRYFYTTLILFMFLGMTQFAVLVWLLAACSKLYKGLFQVLAANSQIIAVASSMYGLGVIFFEGRISQQVKLSLELAGLLAMNVIGFLFLKRLKNGTIQIQYLVEEMEEGQRDGPQGEQREREQPGGDRKEKIEIQLTYQDDKLGVSREKTIDPENLL